MVMLTSCGGDDHHNLGQLEELNVAVLQEQQKVTADKAAIAQAQAAGAPASEIAQLQGIFQVDQAILAASEADYIEMWAQDVAAMGGYNSGSGNIGFGNSSAIGVANNP